MMSPETTPSSIAERIITRDGENYVPRDCRERNVLYWDTKYRVRVRISQIVMGENVKKRREEFFQQLCAALESHQWKPYGNVKGACWAGKTFQQCNATWLGEQLTIATEKWMFYRSDVPQRAGTNPYKKK